jgi:hypothetical protein
VQRVIAIRRVEAHLHVIFLSAVFDQDLPDLVAKVSLHFENETADPTLRIIVPVGQDLFGKRVHAATGLTATDRAKHRNSGIKTSLRNRQPAWTLRRPGLLRVVNFTDYQE